MIDLARYGLEESVGLHIIISNFFWWLSIILVFIAYGYRRLWSVGDMPWAFLFLTFICFAIRELGHLSGSPLIGTIRYIFGVWSAIFMASAFISLYLKICQRKKDSMAMTYTPFILVILFPVIVLYLYISGTDVSDLKKITGNIESLVWMAASSLIIYATYMLGTRTTGGFIRVFMFFQFSAFTAFTWKLLGLIESLGSPIPYSIREIIETLFGLFAIVSMYLLMRMLRKLSRYMHSEKYGHKS
ncbi:hypothetical protein [Candidatus Methanoperedens nitratireducens]|nr:hypothetical protein [Candidatus Methanoperedens nitroreducens]